MGSDDEVCMVGIHGIGGIGKTALAREIYNSIGNQFEASCFLDDVREKTHQHGGLVHLQETLLHEMVKYKDIKFGSVSKGISIIKQRLHTKKVLLILDDVDDLKQLEALVGGCDWYGPGSEVIITTRDLHLLKSHGIEKTYEVEELNKDEALELMWKAFKSNKVDSNYKNILNRALAYASGLPLALEVVGSNLCGKPIEEWESTLDRYKRSPHKMIQKILKVSFDSLEEDEKSVFLDIACCLSGYQLSKVKDILHAHYSDCMNYHIDVLVEKSLVKISRFEWSDANYVTMHDLIKDMGQNIVLQESPKESGKRSRLLFHKDIVSVLEDDMGTGKIEIINMYCGSTDRVVDWNGKAFKKMRNLKTLIIYSEHDSHSHFSKDPEHFPSSLRVLEWGRYPFAFIPSISLSKVFITNCQLLPLENDNPGSIAPSNVKVLHLKDCKLSDEILLVVLKLVPNVEELDLSRSNFTIIPECIQECHFLRRLAFDKCFFFEDMRGVPPNIKYLSAMNRKSETSFSLGSLLLNQELHEDGGTEFLFRARIERIPEWFDHQSKGTSISFWFRKSVPSIALFFHCKMIGEGDISFVPCMRIYGNMRHLRILEMDHGLTLIRMFEDFTYVGDVQLQDMGLESELDEALLRNEWIHANVVFCDGSKSKELLTESGIPWLLIESGIHVFKQKTSMDDIRFTNPY